MRAPTCKRLRRPARRRRSILVLHIIDMRLSFTRKRETGRVGYAGLVPEVRRSIARTTPRVATRPVRLFSSGPSRGGVSLSWIGPRRRADSCLESGVLQRFAPTLLSRWLQCCGIVCCTFTLNRDPHARLARLAGEPPVARDGRSVRAFWRCRISSPVSNKVGARGFAPHWRFSLMCLRKCGAEPRAPTCKRRCVCGG